MKKNAFTLIELLAVIVILAIISLIAVPVLLNIINDSKTSSGEETVKLYIDSVKKAISRKQLENTSFNPTECTIQDNGNLLCNNIDVIVDMKGIKPINGIIEFKNGKIIEDATWVQTSNNNFYSYRNSVIVQFTEKQIKEVQIRLPKEYQKVEYIESTGAQWINTKYFPIQNTNMEIEFEYLGSGSRAWVAISGIRKGSSTIIFWVHPSELKPTIEYAGYDPNFATNFPKIEKGSRHIYKNIGGNFYLDNIKYASTSNTLVKSDIPIYIFAFNNNGNLDNRKPYVRIFNYKLLDDKLSRNFIPCYSKTTIIDADGIERPKGTVGMYDLVEDKFYTNQGTGEFIKGPDV